MLVRDPPILDYPFWALSRVLGPVSGADASFVADAGSRSSARATVAADFGGAPRRRAVHRGPAASLRRHVDAAQLGFVPTSLSDRLDLADGDVGGQAPSPTRSASASPIGAIA